MYTRKSNSTPGANGGLNQEPFIQLLGVKKIYRNASGDFPALRGIDLEIHPGEFVGILGKSGAGKTTLANLITAVDHVTEGEIRIGGVDVHLLNENQAAAWRGRNLGVIYQAFHLISSLSLVENVMLAMDFSGTYRPIRSKETALELLREVELEEHAFKLPGDISGGQQQRVAIARALANDLQSWSLTNPPDGSIPPLQKPFLEFLRTLFSVDTPFLWCRTTLVFSAATPALCGFRTGC